MSHYRYKRADLGQTAIDQALRAVGAVVVPLGDVGKGVPDRMIGFRGQTYLLETKTKSRENKYSIADRENLMRTPAQTKFHAEWNGGPLIVVFTPDDALRAIGAIQSREPS